MPGSIKLLLALLALTGAGWAQNSIPVQVKGRQRWSAEEVDKIYLAACSAVEREFRTMQPVRPQVTLVLGADRNEVVFDRREIRLIRWNPYLFAEGVVIVAFQELMDREKLIIAKRAVNWADSIVEVRAVTK